MSVACHAACKAHAPGYIVMWPLWPSHIFLHYLIDGTVFEKKRY